MAPGIPALGKAVAEDDERAFALLGHMQANAVRLDHPMRDLRHRQVPPGCRLWACPAGFGRSSLERRREGRTDGKCADRREHVASGKRRVLHGVAPFDVTHPGRGVGVTPDLQARSKAAFRGRLSAIMSMGYEAEL